MVETVISGLIESKRGKPGFLVEDRKEPEVIQKLHFPLGLPGETPATVLTSDRFKIPQESQGPPPETAQGSGATIMQLPLLKDRNRK
jgi:hypothetical protein